MKLLKLCMTNKLYQGDAIMVQINNINDYEDNLELLPYSIKLDTNKRMWDWLIIKGNSFTDLYVIQIFKFVEAVINYKEVV